MNKKIDYEELVFLHNTMINSLNQLNMQFIGYLTHLDIKIDLTEEECDKIAASHQKCFDSLSDHLNKLLDIVINSKEKKND